MDIKERFYANLDMIREEAEQLDEKAKWRKTKVATKVTDPEGYDSVSYDYHSDNPRSTGMMKATSDKPYKKGSLMTRGKTEVAKGKVTKSSAARLKDKIKANLDMIREDYDHRYKSLADQLQGYADKDKKNRNKNRTNQKWSKMWSKAAKSSRKKAVTGMEEEAEQLDEAKDSYAKFLKRMRGEAGNSPKDEGEWSKKMKKQEKAVKNK